jgi:hypothetical protein
VKPGAKFPLKVQFSRALALELFRLAGVEVAGFEGRWADYEVHLKCEGVLGERR